jgi:NADH-quinone oxidoreductase subunit M
LEEFFMTNSLLTVIVFVPLIGSLLILLPWGRWLGWSSADPGGTGKDREARLIKYSALIISLIPLALSVILWFTYDKVAGGMQFQVNVPWIPTLNIHYHIGVDGLSVPLIFLTTFLTTLGLWYSARTIKTRVREFFFLFLLLEMGMLGVFVSLDLVLFYVFWEVGLVPMYFLIGIWGQPKDRPQYSAIKFFLYTLAGSVFMLLAILGIYFWTGTFDIVEAAKLKPFAGDFLLSSLAFWAFFVAFAIKVPSFPFHTWLPDAHTAAPTAGSVILAGVLLKLGAYGILRILLPIFPDTFKTYSLVVVALGVISIVYGALVSLAQWDMKRLIAYSSVSHMGYVLLGVGAAAFAVGSTRLVDASTAALNGAAWVMFNHGISTGALFFLVGVIYERSHLRDLKMFGGLSGKLPYYYGLFAVAAFTSLGLPALAGFWGEFFVFRGSFDIVRIWAAIGVIGIVLTAAYILWKIIQYTFLGAYDPHKVDHWTNLTTGAEEHEPRDLVTFEKVTLWPLTAFMVLFGIYPLPLLSLLNSAFLPLMNSLAGK